MIKLHVFDSKIPIVRHNFAPKLTNCKQHYIACEQSQDTALYIKESHE